MSVAAAGITYRACRVLLRVAAVRWLIAVLIPFGFLTAGLTVAGAGCQWLHLVGSVLATFANWAVCIAYFCRVPGAAAGWVTALIPPDRGERLGWPCQPQLAPPFSFYLAPPSVALG